MKTAVEFLVAEINKLNMGIDDAEHEKALDIIEKAKEMEKEQIIDFGQEIIDHLCYGAQSRSWIEEKYNETFKSE